MDRWTVIQLGILLMVVPAQYLVSKYTTSSDEQKSYAIRNLVSGVRQFSRRYLSLSAWREWCQRMLETGADDPTQTPDIQALKLHQPSGYFAASKEARSPRPPHVQYKVGQVIRHKIWGYRGIIIGWDETAKAPESWLKQMHTSKNPHWRSQPNYSILVDTRDRLTPQSTYVPEENIEIIANTQVLHPDVEHLFEHYDGSKYLPRPWLREVYPHD